MTDITIRPASGSLADEGNLMGILTGALIVLIALVTAAVPFVMA